MQKQNLAILVALAAGFFYCSDQAVAADDGNAHRSPVAHTVTALNPPTLPNGEVGVAYLQTLSATTSKGGTVTWSFSGLPPGLTLSTSSGPKTNLQGVPTLAGTYLFSVSAENSAAAMTVKYTVTITAGATTPTPATDLTVTVSESGGTATAGNFNLTVKSGTTTVFSGAATAKQGFSIPAGSTYAVTEATTSASAGYTASYVGGCQGTMGTSAALCQITNTFVATPPPTNPANLIPNPTLTQSTLTPGLPDYWLQGSNYGNNVVSYSYPAPSACPGTSVGVTISTFNGGDNKWYPSPTKIPVTPNTNYTISDSYDANVSTGLVMEFLESDGATVISNLSLLSPPATNNTCGTVQTTFTTPANAAFVAPFHLLQSVGTLATTNFSLVKASPSTSNLFPKGLISQVFDDNWYTHWLNAFPILTATGLKATFAVITSFMLNAEQTLFPSADNPLNAETTVQSVTWGPIYTDPTNHAFGITNTYNTSAQSTTTVIYTPAATNISTSTVLGNPPAGTNAQENFSFTLPELAPSAPIYIKQAVTTGTLTSSNVVVTETVGRMNTEQTMQLQTAGHEIAPHTVNHCKLAILFANPGAALFALSNPDCPCPDTGPLSAPTTAQSEIDNARTTLMSLGFAPLDTFEYPYGSGTGTPVEQLVQADGMIAARGTGSGYNTKSTDPYALLTMAVDITVTNFSTVKDWIDYATANHVWLILTYHQIEDSFATLTANGEIYGTTTAMLQQIATYLQQQQAAGNVVVATVHDVMTQYWNQ